MSEYRAPMVCDAPIGIFDSGIGGLTVYRALRECLPNESLLYLGDIARLPYGNKSPETIVRYALEDAQFLVERGAKAIVVACNSASAFAVPALAERWAVPIVGMIEAGAQAALAMSANKRIGVMGTRATVGSEAYTQAIAAQNADAQVFAQACPLLVPMVEEHCVRGERVERVLREYLDPLLAQSVDTIILGCTHYPLLRDEIARICGADVTLIDSGAVAAQQVRELLMQRGLCSESGTAVRNDICVTDHAVHVGPLWTALVGDAAVQRVVLPSAS